jgi:hypothetical protein
MQITNLTARKPSIPDCSVSTNPFRIHVGGLFLFSLHLPHRPNSVCNDREAYVVFLIARDGATSVFTSYPAA